ncbi:MAG: response regulator [Cytophagales bacterium]|nr:response regulator [Cytophagales bacterium]
MEDILKDIRLLVADDDYTNVEIILTYLEGITEHLHYASDGERACSLALKKTPDLIIMDWQMPKMDGIEAIKVLQSQEATSVIPIIVATGVMTSSENLQKALDAGAVDFLRKPFNPIEFKARVSSALRIRNQHQTIQQMLVKEKAYIQSNLEHKERELTSMAILDHQKNALLNSLLNQVSRLDRITSHVHATEIKSIEKDIRSQLDLSKSWETFKVHFEEMHQGFFEKLDKQFEGLSLNERKLCAYIKMGLGNYEISQMTTSSDDAVRKAINRLKKKLNLGPKEDIRNFLFGF